MKLHRLHHLHIKKASYHVMAAIAVRMDSADHVVVKAGGAAAPNLPSFFHDFQSNHT